MNKKLLTSMPILIAFIFALFAVSPKLHAIDRNNRYFAYGVGQRSCEDYVKFREGKLAGLEGNERYTKDELYEIVDKIVEHWMAGFLTAHDLYVADNYNVAGKTTINDMESQLEKSCRANPQ